MGMTINKFAEEMSVIIPRLHREFLRKQQRMLTSFDISFAQIGILHFLKDLRVCKMSEVAKMLSVTTSAATGQVDKLVRAGMLKRVYDSEDRRIINIRLTPKGKRTINTVIKERQKLMTDIFRHFTPNERASYLNIVKKMYGILTKRKR
jgi:DNA-binding MarR family transcriptional regulator